MLIRCIYFGTQKGFAPIILASHSCSFLFFSLFSQTSAIQIGRDETTCATEGASGFFQIASLLYAILCVFEFRSPKYQWLDHQKHEKVITFIELLVEHLKMICDLVIIYGHRHLSCTQDWKEGSVHPNSSKFGFKPSVVLFV